MTNTGPNRRNKTENPSNPAKYPVKRGARGVQFALESLYQKSSTNGSIDVTVDTGLWVGADSPRVGANLSKVGAFASASEMVQVFFRLSKWENLGYIEEV